MSKPTILEWMYDQLTEKSYDKESGKHILEQAQKMEYEQAMFLQSKAWLDITAEYDKYGLYKALDKVDEYNRQQNDKN
jgi:hypothetical protein